ncbi:PREDICTED: probable ATP-dependent RNA helicase DDX31 [Cyphomyrmex costatus]|uniref:ATP-dependent RNA helicase n=1 Tax=Cyphomyrmex costatus TaxID=456900 RepID=A0A151ICX9_9HYME|nr:PREDICTED: probable ATP-dependent RNA helicase DDX31 [Cyphomyrmex costatus]KYM98271.1 DEAD-box ATP-dependent RNA helicase 17 [Cyphomyrmex costatus]
MTIQDMDICLNVTAGPVVTTKKNALRRTKSSKTSIKRLKNQSFHKDAVLNSKESRKTTDTQETGFKKRIKQKSLSAIFAKKLKETNSAFQNIQQPQISSRDKDLIAKSAKLKQIEPINAISKKDVSGKIPFTLNLDSINELTTSFTNATNEHVGRKALVKRKDNSKVENKLNTTVSSQLKSQSESDLLNTTKKHNISKNNFKVDKICKVNNKSAVLKSDKIPSTANSDSTNESTVCFTKTTEKHVDRTLLAKKRDDLKSESKRSLSDIFSNQLKNQNESNAPNVTQKYDVSKDNFKSDKKYKVTRESPALRNTKETDILDKKKEKRCKKKIVNNNKESDEIPKLIHRKLFSLFRNNPDVPTIGQRFVKPVNEPVFTEITFADLNIHPYMISNLEQNMCITKMTTVQQKAIPQIFLNKDVLIRSQTGSGKTLAYALPIVELLHKIRPELNRNSGLLALVVVPTRELALQTYECFIKLVKPFTWIVPGYIVGGEKRKAEKARLRKGCNILISTPGRLLDHIKHTKALRLNNVKYFVLDEADRMLDMGYEMDISGIVSALEVSCSDDEKGYDAMKIFKQNNSKKIFTDEKIEETLKEDDVKSKTEESNIDKSDSDRAASIVSSKKMKKDTKHSSINKKSNSIVKNIQNIEEDNKNRWKRQTILLSATLTQAVEKLAGLTMHDPIFVDAAKKNLEMSGGDTSTINEDLIVPQSVIQSYIVTPPKLRMVTLSAYIAGRCQTPGQHKILIFMATQDMVDYHTEILSSILTKPIDDNDEDSDSLVDVEFFKLHGNMTQKERTEVFKTFSQAKSGVLLCTDVAARGLDMPNVDCVVQYTGPISARDYVHRIGRTARAGCSGTATIFLTPSEIEFVRMLESRRIRIKQQDMNDVLDKLLGPLSKHNSVRGAAVALQNDFEDLVLENRKLGAKACKAYVSWVRFYSSYPRDMREVFDRKELHLGHYAKSFALRAPPQQIGGIGKKLREKEISKPRHNNRLSYKPSDGVPQKKQRTGHGDEKRAGLLKRVRMLNTSEYDSGLEPLKKPKK